MKKRKLVACLMAGVLVLAVSAGAAFESVNGYAAYKNGVKALLLQTNNVTLEGKFAVTVDGKTVTKANGTVATDGKNYSSEFWAEDSDGSKEESHEVYLDGVNTWYSGENAANKSYYSNEYDQEWNSWNNLLGYHEDDEMESRMITFLELAADSVVGDLKNNFVSLGSEDGLNKYQVEVSKQQVPALVNAGLSLMAYSQFSYTGYSTYYQDYEASLVSYYEKTTGQPFPQEIWDNYYEEWNDEWVEANQDAIDKFEEIQSDFSDIGYDVLEKKGGGVAYVNAIAAVEKLIPDVDGDEKTGVRIVAAALAEPVRQIAVNAGVDGSVVLEKIKSSDKAGYGFDAYKEVYCDMIPAGIVDPAKVTRSALENAASVSAMVLTTESLVADKPEPPAPAPAAPDMGGMY